MENIFVYLLVGLSIVLIISVIFYLYYSLYRYKLQAINAGLEDETIKKEYAQSQSVATKIMDGFSVLFTVFLLVLFVGSLCAGKRNNLFTFSGRTAHVVASGSMSEMASENIYLEEHNLYNQFDVYDVIITQTVDSPQELLLYDIVVYNKSDKKIVHRIVDIYTENGNTYYTLRGDANNYNDSKPVTFEEITGKYTNIRIPAVGIFVIFLQSALGYVAMGLVFVLELIIPFFEKRIEKAIKERLETIGFITQKTE